MSENYFSKLPLFTYSNTVCVDITRRTVIANTIQQDLFAYYPYELKSHQRPDTIADRYYQDPSYDWLVYLSNKVVDPYYSFPMDDKTFSNFINAKYQNLANAQQKILYWEMNWAGSTDDQITQSFYDTNVPEPLKKYYEAVYGEETRIVFYRRRRADWKASTNMVVRFQVGNTSGTFQMNEVVKLSQPTITTTTMIFLDVNSVSPLSIPADCTNPKVECIGASGTAAIGNTTLGGGGAAGGSYALKNMVAVTPGSTVPFQVGDGDTWFGSNTTVLAKAGGSATGSIGGLADVGGSIGDVTYSGGNGWTAATINGAPGGGAAGPHGPGGNANATVGGTADNGTVPGSTNFGISGTQWDATHGSGSGAGRATNFGFTGGSYGGGGSGSRQSQLADHNTSGLIVLSYTITLSLAANLSNSYVSFSNSSQITTQHVMGNLTSNSAYMFLTGTTSGATANVSQIVIVANNISQTEMVYWSPVYAYDMEVGKNEQRKFIRLIDSKYAISVAEKLRKEMLK